MASDSSYGQVIRLQRTNDASSDPPQVGREALQDVLCAAAFDASATAFVLSSLPRTGRPVLWVQDRASRRENGALYVAGTGKPVLEAPILQVDVSHPRDVLWAMEEGASCAGLGAVIGEIHGAPAVLDFTATKRLALRAEVSGVPVWLIRSGDPGVLSAARARWRVGAIPSRTNAHDPRAPGTPMWSAELFRARGRAPGRWVGWNDPTVPAQADRLCLVSATGDGSLASDHPARADAARR